MEGTPAWPPIQGFTAGIWRFYGQKPALEALESPAEASPVALTGTSAEFLPEAVTPVIPVIVVPMACPSVSIGGHPSLLEFPRAPRAPADKRGQ